MQPQSRKQWAALLLLLCLRDTAAFAANPVGNVGSGAEHAAQSGVLEQLQQMMDDSHMPIFISDEEDRYLCAAIPRFCVSTIFIIRTLRRAATAVRQVEVVLRRGFRPG